MAFESFEAQKIVDRLMNILGKNINVIGTDGKIMASGDKGRIGLYHGAAEFAAREGRTILVDKSNIEGFEGCKTGVNIPVFSKNKVVCVVGITGEPSEVEGYGLIVKELVELMIQEEERKKQELFYSRAIKSFAKELINYTEDDDPDVLYSRARLINFDCSIPRIVIVADICNFSALTDVNEFKSEIRIQSLKQQIVDIINSISDLKHDFAFNLSEGRFVILKKSDDSIREYCLKIHELSFKKTGLSLQLGLGTKCEVLKDYHKSYVIASNTLDIGKKLKSKEFVYSPEDFRLQLLLKQIGPVNRQEYLESLGEVFAFPNDKQSLDLLQTIKVYFENSMNAKDTAKALFIHRNTLTYRLNKFVELYNLDISDPYLCMHIYLGIVLMELDLNRGSKMPRPEGMVDY